jgi:hypothetical protein
VLMIVVIALAAVPASAVAAAVLVSLASRREDRAWTLSQPPAGAARAAARRIVGFHSEDPRWISAAGTRRTRPPGPGCPAGAGRRPVPPTTWPRGAWPGGGSPASPGRQGHPACAADSAALSRLSAPNTMEEYR